MFSQVAQVGAIYQIPPAISSLQWCKILPPDVNVTGNSSQPGDSDFDRLLPTLLECFAIVFCGFLAGKCNIISQTDIKGLNDFTTYFSLPPLIFLNLVTINFHQVNWLFVAGILVGKVLVFLLVATVTAYMKQPGNLSYAGLYGIFCTQGNDFGLAYPIVASLYGSKRPLYAGYMYLIAPTSLLFTNPMGFILMEVEKNRSSDECVPKGGMSKSLFRMIGNVSWNILKNPVVFFTILGVFGNFLFHGSLPSVIYAVLQILSSAFSAPVLFLLGFSVASCGGSTFSSKEGLLIPSVLLITKMIISPLITRSSVSMLCAGASDVEDLADYGFLYGMVPTGPIVMLFAAEYALRTEMMASTMILCTALFGPLVFVLARMLSLKVKGIEEFSDELRSTMLVLSILTMLSCAWIGLSLLLSKKWKRQIYKITGCLLTSQVAMAVGVLIWGFVPNDTEWLMYIEIAFISAGQLAARVWVTLLAVTLVYLRRNPLSTFVTGLKRPLFFGFGIPAVFVIMLLIVTAIGACEPDLRKELPFFIYGTAEAVGSIVVLTVCLCITGFSLVLYFRSSPNVADFPSTKKLEGGDSIHSDLEKSVVIKGFPMEKDLMDSTSVAIYKLTRPDSDPVISRTGMPVDSFYPEDNKLTEKTVNQEPTLKRSETSFSATHLLSSEDSNSSRGSSPIHFCDVSSMTSSSSTQNVLDDSGSSLRHVILLILCCISMAVGLTISTWKLSTTQPTGLFVAMEFLDAVLNIGQGMFVFIVFITDSKYIVTPIAKWLKKVRRGIYSLDDQDNTVEHSVQQLCAQFFTFHRDNCIRDLPRTITKSNQMYTQCFTGTQFVDWILKVGLATHRTAAEVYGQRLFRGKILISEDGAIQFHDNSAYLYSLNKSFKS